MNEHTDTNGLKRLEELGLVATDTAGLIVAAMDFIRQSSGIAVICGDAGIGKTFIAERYGATDPSVWFAAMSPGTAGLTGSLERIARLVGVEGKDIHQGKARMALAIEECLRGTGGLLVVDEAQHLGESAREQIVSLGKNSRVGVVFLGRIELFDRFERDEWLKGQVAWGVRIERPCPGEVKKMLVSWGVRGRESRELCANIAKGPGTFRSLSKVLGLAKVRAASKGSALGAVHIKAAWDELSGAWQTNREVQHG